MLWRILVLFLIIVNVINVSKSYAQKRTVHRVFQKDGHPVSACHVIHTLLRSNGTTEYNYAIKNAEVCCPVVCKNHHKTWQKRDGVKSIKIGPHIDETFWEDHCVCLS